jgi:hypothetical protein
MSTAQSKPTRAIIYVRLSDTTDDAAGAASLADQVDQARQRADGLGWTVGKVLTENDLTGSGKRSHASAYKQVKVVHPDGREGGGAGGPSGRAEGAGRRGCQGAGGGERFPGFQ